MQARVTRRRGLSRTISRKFHSGIFGAALCVAILDVLRFSCENNPLPALRKHSDLRCRSCRRIKSIPGKFLAYSLVYWFEHVGSGMKICLESKRQQPWLAKYRISFYADDRTGLLRTIVLSVLELLPRLTLSFCEIALDFSPLSNVGRRYVLARAVFGKSRRDLAAVNPMADWWGSRLAAKRIVSYSKDSIWGHRVEFKLRSRFLLHYGIHDVLDLPKLLEILPHHHILFARLDEDRLERGLRNSGLNAASITTICETTRQKEADLSAVLSYLRRIVGLKNVRRLLVPLATNRLVRHAVKRFAEQWTIAPRRSK